MGLKISTPLTSSRNFLTRPATNFPSQHMVFPFLLWAPPIVVSGGEVTVLGRFENRVAGRIQEQKVRPRHRCAQYIPTDSLTPAHTGPCGTWVVTPLFQPKDLGQTAGHSFARGVGTKIFLKYPQAGKSKVSSEAQSSIKTPGIVWVNDCHKFWSLLSLSYISDFSAYILKAWRKDFTNSMSLMDCTVAATANHKSSSHLWGERKGLEDRSHVST
jgi:hypothetical protein